ncbi:hypothetical protein [Streptomyces johnsoniae]|uniref:Uncharacterized protein n=1 Tax=Streptomyces johnsoniae TaxID=3075532 RepID=A0ABU2S4E7_9ACTN|nr:hypothetical protein [Streptomyces sp. DSM 41886]MDT0443858.1 hypothetical protein [Streptomyces sp. DSM 41886]
MPHTPAPLTGAPSSPGNAYDVLAELTAVLAEHGITLPSLELDRATLTSPYTEPLIELGRCNLDTARAISAALGR